MKQKICRMALSAFAVITMLTGFTAQAARDLMGESQEALAAFLRADPSLKPFLDQSAGYAVFPNVAKGGLVVGAARGRGVAYQKGQPIGTATITQASIGAQAGGQTFTELLVFETPLALENFKTGKLELGADISAIAAAEGVAKTAKFANGVAVFLLPKKGLMVQASVGGQRFKFEPLK